MIPGWLDEIEEEVTACLSPSGSRSVGDLADSMRVSESCAFRYVALLASAGRLSVEWVSLPSAAGPEGGDRQALVGRIAA